MSDKVNKAEVQSKRIRGRNYDDVVRQLVDTYHSGNGWSVVKVTPSIMSVEVYLERSSLQETVDEKEKVASKDESKSAEVKKDVVASKPTAKTTQTSKVTQAKAKTVETKK